MTSLILTILYLAKDTLHRWLTRISSPLARVLVVIFLSLCALCFLGSYVISAKVIRDRIRSQGGDMIHAIIMPSPQGAVALPTEAETRALLDADSIVLKSVGSITVNRRGLPVYTYDFRRAGQFLPLMAAGGGPTLLCPAKDAPFPEGPLDVRLQRENIDRTICVRHLPEEHLLNRLMPGGGVLVQPDTPNLPTENIMQRMLLRLRHMESSADLRKAERFLNTLMHLEGAQGTVSSAAELMQEMDVILGNQTQCRATFCLGIIGIVGILLTALAGMEYRQNEYIYTLMKSFGIHPLMLVAGFLAENVVLVGLSFWAAVEVFLRCQRIIVAQFFKMGQYGLSMEEIMPEIRLIAAALLVCVLVSSLPILVAANREIGKVLK